MDTLLAMQKPSRDKTGVGFYSSSSEAPLTNRLVFVRESNAPPAKVMEQAHGSSLVEHGSQRSHQGLGYNEKAKALRNNEKKANSRNQGG